MPLYSVGVWGKVDLHTRGNIDGFRRAKGPKKLKMVGPVNAFVANREFNSVELHEKLLLPFYEHYLKGKDTEYLARPAVEYFVRGADAVRSAETWPPPGVRYVTWHLSGQKSGSVTSLNDGTLAREPAAGAEKTSYRYPDPGWMLGVVGFGPNNQPDPARRVLTFTTAPLAQDLEIAGPIKLTLHASSTRNDMDFFVKLSEQMPQSAEDRAKGLNPASYWITKGWLRASHRALDPGKSRPRWSPITRTPIRSRSSPEKSTASTSRSSRWRTASRAATACGWKSSTAIPPSPTCCGRTTTRPTRSAPTRSITRRNILLR